MYKVGFSVAADHGELRQTCMSLFMYVNNCVRPKGSLPEGGVVGAPVAPA